LIFRFKVSQWFLSFKSNFSIKLVLCPPLNPATTYKALLSNARVVWKFFLVFRLATCVHVSVVTSYTSHLFMLSGGRLEPMAKI